MQKEIPMIDGKVIGINQLINVYITRYALTTGVRFQHARYEADCGELISSPPGSYSYLHGYKKDWCLTELEARQRFKEMKEAKLKSLKKSIDKINQLEFEVTP